ncbi:uncharacterized protein LOC110449640 [Mizuhopecten yessoensis]|uniref:uncharacterized protein LOC110449640 n=1 Tax=Mizuhopecten yessoensis TaxID=6573 RepID=UPI000B45D167|nr:uncharacterized protein LOC110449640 [Mizuhopecten yessoensis]
MSKVMVSTGCVSFVIFCLGIVSVFLGVARMYYVAVLALVTSLLFKLISILLWIPVRVSFDWDLRGEMYSALHAYYKTDNASPGIDKYLSDNNLGFNTLFYQGKCCLLQSSVFTTLRSTLVLWRDWPWTCYPCEYEKGVRWQILQSHSTAMCPGVSAYTEECTTTVLDSTLHRYDTTAVVFSAIMILLEVLLIIILDRAYKVRVDPKEGEQARGLFSSLFLNNRFINDTTMPKCKYFALGLCLFKVVSLLLEVIMTVGIILEKFEPGYFDGTEQEFLNDVFSGDISLGYVTHALGMLLLTLTVISFVLNLFTIIAVLRKWKYFLFALLFVTIVLWACNVVILGLLSRVLDVAYCCDKSPNCSYRTDTDSDSFQQFCTKVYHDKIHKVIGVSIAYVITMIILQVVCVVLSDRLYKRLQEQSDQDKDASGILSSVWTASTNNRFINQNRMPNFTNLAAIFMSFKGITMIHLPKHLSEQVCELVVSIGIILQKFSPDYFYTTEMVYLNDIYSGDLTLGYVIHVTAIVMFCVILLSLGLGVLGVIAVYKGWRRVMSVIVIPTLVLTIVELICLGLLSLVLSVAYCCDYGSACTFRTHGNSPPLEDLCKHGFQGAVFNVVGSFIGFIVAHLVLQVVALCLADRIYKRMSIKEAPDDPSYGMFQSILISMVNNRFINQERMPNYTVLAAVFMTLKGIAMVGELVVSIGIILQKFSPDYFYTTEMVYLNEIYSGDLTLGYVTHVTAIVMFCVIVLSLGLGVLGVIAVYKGWRRVMSVVVILTLLLSITEGICLGLLSLVLSVAYCCDYGSSCTFYASSSTLSLENLCKHGFQGAVYNVVGTFIGFIVVHLVLQIVVMGLADRIYKRVSTNLNKGIDIKDHGLFRTILRKFVNNRLINQEKMPDFTLMAFVYVAGNILMTAIDISAWIAILLYVVRYDSQLDGMYVGTLYLAEMTRGASITLLVIIPISSIFNVCKVVWCVIKYDTGLLWSTLPEILRLVVDSVILGLYAQLLESIRLSDRDIYRGMYGLTLAYLCVNIAAQLVLFAIKDRLHKRIETSSSVTDSSGLITRLWRAVVRHRFFETDSGKTNKTALGFCFLSCCLVVWEIAVWVAVLLQAESPGYLHGTFRTELGQEYDDDSFWRLLVTLLVLEWFYVIFHVVTVIAVIKRRRPFLYGASGLLSCILVSDLVTSGIASDWLDKAYNCSSSSKFCSTHVSKLYELCGVFIGLNIVHLCLVGILLGLCIYQLCISAVSTKISSIGEDVKMKPSKQTDQKDGVISSTRPLTSSSVGSVSSITDN